MTVRERVKHLLKAWPKIYPHAHCELDFRNPLELFVATILSAQSTDKRVNMVTPELFARFPTPSDLASAKSVDLEALIRSTGFFRAKARSLLAMAQQVVEGHNGEQDNEANVEHEAGPHQERAILGAGRQPFQLPTC